jgi:DNA-binding NarL/FixJ family response regulator
MRAHDGRRRSSEIKVVLIDNLSIMAEQLTRLIEADPDTARSESRIVLVAAFEENTEDTIEQVCRLRPDVVIVDIILNGGADEGLDVIRTLRTRLRGTGKILAWSQQREDYRQRARDAGAIDCIHPARDDVIAAIHAVMKGEPPRSRAEIGEIRGLTLHLKTTEITVIGTDGAKIIRLPRADYFPIFRYLAEERAAEHNQGRAHNAQKWLSFLRKGYYEITQATAWTQITEKLDIRTLQIQRENDRDTGRTVHIVSANFLAKFLAETNAQIKPFLPLSAQSRLLIVGPERFSAKPYYTLNHDIVPDMIKLS